MRTCANASRDRHLRELSPIEGIRRLVEITFDHFVATPDLIRLMSVENIHFGKYLRRSQSVKPLYRDLLETLEILLRLGQDEGCFRPEVDAVDLYLSISGLAYFFLSNQHTLSWLLDGDHWTQTCSETASTRGGHGAELSHLTSAKCPFQIGVDDMRGSWLTTFLLLATAIVPASAADKLSVRLDFSPSGVQAAMRLRHIRAGSRKRVGRRHPGRARLRQHDSARRRRSGRCRPGAGRPRWIGPRQGRDHPFDRDVPAPH